jgi:hypothetical protein
MSLFVHALVTMKLLELKQTYACSIYAHTPPTFVAVLQHTVPLAIYKAALISLLVDVLCLKLVAHTSHFTPLHAKLYQ